MTELLMKLIRLFRPFVRMLGADVNQFEAIMNAKLTIDFRKEPGSLNSNRKKKMTFGKQLLFYGMFGIFSGMIFLQTKDVIFGFTIFYSILIVMLTTILLTEFSSVIFDENENDIYLPRPVSSRTLVLTRLVHVQIYLGLIGGSMSIPGLIIIIFTHGGLMILGMLISVMVASWMALLFCMLLFQILSKFISGERFKDTLNYLQIGIAILIMGGYQLLPRMFEVISPDQAIMSTGWWTYLVPTIWLAGFTSLFSSFTSSYDLIMAGITVLFTVLGSILVVRFMSSGFGTLLSTDDKTENKKEKEKGNTKTGIKIRIRNVARNLLCVSDMEKAGWQMTMSVTKRDRKFKQAVYPAFGYILIMSFIFLKPDFKDFIGSLHNMAGTSKYLIFIFMGFFGVSTIYQLPYTDNAGAGWIYQALPAPDKKHLQTGAIKAMLYKFYIPVYLMFTIMVIMIWPASVLIYLLLGAVGTACYAILGEIFMKNPLPFTQTRDMQRKGGMTLRMMLYMVLMGVMIGIIYLLSLINMAYTVFATLCMSAGLIMSFRALRNKPVEL
jgi:ABC-2 type transport system permease protein